MQAWKLSSRGLGVLAVCLFVAGAALAAEDEGVETTGDTGDALTPTIMEPEAPGKVTKPTVAAQPKPAPSPAPAPTPEPQLEAKKEEPKTDTGNEEALPTPTLDEPVQKQAEAPAPAPEPEPE